ncbi:S26 family signal peptidase [Actinoplanes sp. NPDC049548]|uniref:S26 family signal peptidase n=1 Tax=Actinoplanes sp. NPDC049548 TaxID=3155152 RepID=UPI00343CB462
MIRAAVAAALLTVATLPLLYLRRRMVVIEVSGHSMHPTYRDGERVLVRRASLRHVRAGEAVVFALPPSAGNEEGPPRRGRLGGHRWLIKRAAALPGQQVPGPVREAAKADTVPAGHLVVLGDNPGASIDSRSWGLLPEPYLLGIVRRRMVR